MQLLGSAGDDSDQAVRRRRVADARTSPRITHPPTTTRSTQNVEVGSAFVPTSCSAYTA